MSAPAITPEELIALLRAKATALPTEASLLLVRHLQCKQSIAIARILSDAVDRDSADSPSLPAPADLLPPLG